jgi:hypothetical protein
MDILTGYEGAIQEENDDSCDDTVEALRLARAELMEVLEIALAWSKVIPEPQPGQKDFRWSKGQSK